MNKSKKIFLGLFLAAALGALVLYINGCGGGGGSDASSPAAAAASQSGTSGKVAAAVTLSGRVSGRTVGVTTGTVTVNISITGTYSETGEEFGPITESVVIDLAAGYGVVRVLDIPIGVNHLMVAEADWGGTIETVKAIIPAVEEGETTSVNASAQTTAVANVAIAYAEQQGFDLADIDAETLSRIQLGVEFLVQNGDYAGVSIAEVIALLDELESVTAIAVTPATATVIAGATESFTAVLTDSASQAVSASPTWSVTSTLGSIDTNGLFTASGLGQGTVTATFGAVSGTAAVTVSAACSIDTDCDDTNAATYDVCNNPGTVSAVCANTPYTCVTNADCDDSNPDTNDICTNGGTLTATCSNPIAAACFADTECDDADANTIDTCYYAGTINAVCGHSTNVAAGNITADTTWGIAGSPYILAGQVQINSGVTLTIDPGVIVQFDYPNAGSDLFLGGDSTLSGIRVDGTLNAIGSAASPITFTLSAGSLSNGAGFWGGIYFTSSSTGSALQYANMMYPSYAIQIDGSTPTISNIAITEAASPLNSTQTPLSYHVSVKTPDGWQEVDQWHYGLQFVSQSMNLAGLLPDADGEYKVRIQQIGAHAAHIDSIQLSVGNSKLQPVAARNIDTGADVLYKMAAQDNDVLDAHLKTFDITFETPREPSPFISLSMNAREEFDEVVSSGKPFTFPENKFYEEQGAHHYTYTMGSTPGALTADGVISAADALPQPVFATFVHPESGHPDGTVYGYIKDNGHALYATLDFTPDNTFDGDADYATLYVRVDGRFIPFKVSETDKSYGNVGFNYSGNAKYQHKVYEFAIPLSLIGNPAPGQEIEYMFEAYGTASIFGSTITVLNTTSNFSLSDISIAYAAGAAGSISGITMQYVSGASNSLTNISIDGSLYNALVLYNISNLAITNLAVTNPANTGFTASGITDSSCTNCSVTNAGYYGANLSSFTNFAFSSCVFNNSGSYGLYLYGMDGTNSITNCDVSFNNGYGVYYSGGYNYGGISITGSRFAQNCSYGIYFYTGSGYESAVNISNTNVVDNVYTGIVAGPSSVTSLDGVYLGGNNSAGAGVADTSTAIPDSGSTPQQYTGIGARTNPAATAVSGPATTAGAATCGYY